jgi:hypothetical protein
VISSAVSCFDPVSIEVAGGFRLLRVFAIAQMLRLAVGEPVSSGKLIALPPLGLLSGRSKIHKFSHPRLDGNWIR